MTTLNDKKSYSPAKKFMIFLAFAICFGAPNYTQYQFSPLGAQIIEQFSLSPVQFNSIFTAPMIPAIFTSIIAGLLVDRFGFKPVVLISILLTTIGAWTRVVAGSYSVMYIGMILVGVSAGVLSANSSKILAQLFGPEKVGVIMGLVLSISTMGLVLSMSTTTMLPSMTVAFIVAAVICTVALILWLVVIPGVKPGQSLHQAPAAQAEESVSLGKMIVVVLKNKYVWFASLALFCINGAMTGMGSSVPTALQSARGLSADAAGLVGSLMMVGNLLGSLFSPSIALKTGKFRLVLMICGAISVVGCAFAWLAPAGILLYIAMVITGYAFGSGMSMILAVAVQLPGVGPKYAGTAGGVIATLELLGGVVLPTYIASAIAGTNYHIYFIIIGLSSLFWILGIYLLPKSLDKKG